MIPFFGSIVDKLKIVFNIQSTKHSSNNVTNSHNITNKYYLFFSPNAQIHSPNDLEALFPKRSANVQQVAATVTARTGVPVIEADHDKPTKEEMALVQIARGNAPYNSIDNVKINRDSAGNIKSIQWTES